MTKFIESPAVKNMWTNKRIKIYVTGMNVMAGNASVRLEASEVEAYEECEGSETCPWLRVRRFPRLRLLLLRQPVQAVTSETWPTKSLLWFSLVRISEDGQKQNYYGDPKMVGKPTSEFASHLMPHRTTQSESKSIKWSSITPNNLIALLHTTIRMNVIYQDFFGNAS